MKRFTVFTPTFNRGYIIEKLYKSLQRQTFRDFEWLVIDDGSTDNTAEIFSRICSEANDFPIRYFKTNNGGKHRAINRGVKEANGELFYIVDSDDFLLVGALENADQIEKTIPESEKEKYCGICGLRGYDEFNMIGTTFVGDLLDITAADRANYKIAGDKAEIFYTDVLRRFPFPEFENENFLTESIVWDRMAHDGYLLRFFNDIQIVCNYLPDGLTNQGQSLFIKNPKGYGLFLSQKSEYKKLCGLFKWNAYYRYYNELRNTLSYCEMARNLNINCLLYYIRIFGMKLFYKLYD